MKNNKLSILFVLDKLNTNLKGLSPLRCRITYLGFKGGIEMIKSQSTGQYYATAKKAVVSTTFDEATCKNLMGSEFPGKICKIQTELYSYTIKDTGEQITLSHKYIYLPEDVDNEEEVKAKAL